MAFLFFSRPPCAGLAAAGCEGHLVFARFFCAGTAAARCECHLFATRPPAQAQPLRSVSVISVFSAPPAPAQPLRSVCHLLLSRPPAPAHPLRCVNVVFCLSGAGTAAAKTVGGVKACARPGYSTSRGLWGSKKNVCSPASPLLETGGAGETSAFTHCFPSSALA